MMKKIALFAIAVLSVGMLFAADVHFGVESSTGVTFVYGETGDPTVDFAIKPYIAGDNFMFRFRAMYGDSDTLLTDFLDFDAGDAVSIINSSLKYVDKIEGRTDNFTAGIARGYSSRNLEGLLGNAAGKDNLDIIGKVELKTGAVDFDFAATRFIKTDSASDYVNAQYAYLKVKPGTSPMTFAMSASRYAEGDRMTVSPWFALGFMAAPVLEVQFGAATDFIINGEFVSESSLFAGYGADISINLDFGSVALGATGYLDNNMRYFHGIMADDTGTARILGIEGSLEFNFQEAFRLAVHANFPFAMTDPTHVMDNADSYYADFGLKFGIFDLSAKAEVTGLIEKIRYGTRFLNMFEDGDLSAKLSFDFDTFRPYVEASLTDSTEVSGGKSAKLSVGCVVGTF